MLSWGFKLWAILRLLPVFVQTAAADILIHTRDFGNRGDMLKRNPHPQAGSPLWAFVVEHDCCAHNKPSPIHVSKLRRLNHRSALSDRVNDKNLTFKFHSVRCGLTTQAQRPGAGDATIATATLPPGSLQ